MELGVIFAYHDRTKHHYHRSARSLGYLDWANQPDPFRRYAGAPVFQLPFDSAQSSPSYESLYTDRACAQPLSVTTLSVFLEHALAVSAIKSYEGSSWKLRCNPSSGNLHPTEGYVILPPLEGLSEHAGVYHYVSDVHALEQRCTFPEETMRNLLTSFPEGTFLAALSSIHWREAWKYGERAYRYCNHDLGHALAAFAFSAAALGWSCRSLDALDGESLGTLLGVGRNKDVEGCEPEYPETIIAVFPNDAHTQPSADLLVSAIAEVAQSPWRGTANSLSDEHVDWEVIDAVTEASLKPETERKSFPSESATPEGSGWSHGCTATAHTIFRQRRSAVAFDGVTGISRHSFFTMLARTLPKPGQVPWNAWGEETAIHLGIFVHRVADLAPGLYCFVRCPEARVALQAAMQSNFSWDRPEGCPEHLPLCFLEAGDYRGTAAQVSCTQEIAGASAFSLGMIADFEGTITRHGPWYYPRLFWEAGMIGQVLYLEAEAAGLRATGIGCYFDDPVHDLFGLSGRTFQSLYHFTVGGPVEDTRLTTDPPYSAERRARSGWIEASD